MGTIASKDTRRISFDNTFAINPALAVQKSIEDDNVLDINTVSADKSDELLFPNSDKPLEVQEDREIDYWANRVDCLRREHRLINKIIETEYEKTIENTNKLLERPKITEDRIQKLKPCFDYRSKILQCYEANPRQPLVCSSIVQAFSNCVASCELED